VTPKENMIQSKSEVQKGVQDLMKQSEIFDVIFSNRYSHLFIL
jgi:hypothetical protein